MTSQLFIILFLFISSTSQAQISPENSEKLRKAVFLKVNELRDSVNLVSLEGNSILKAAAANHSSYMAKNKILSHDQSTKDLETPYKRVKYFRGNKFDTVGENILFTKKVKLPLQESQINIIAEKIYLAWRNSPPHYSNMIKPEFTFGDLSFAYEKDNQVIYATHVFGKKGIQIPNQISTNAFGLNPKNDFCDDALNSYKNLLSNMGNCLSIEGNKVMFYYHNLDYFNEILKFDSDGFAIDIVLRNQFECGAPNNIDSSPFHDGVMLKPTFKNEILSKNIAKSEFRIISELAIIPDEFLNKDFSISLILIVKGGFCDYLVNQDVPSSAYKLKNIELKLLNPDKVKIDTKGIIKSQEIYYSFETGKSKPISDQKIQSYDLPIHSIQINSYSSVEGDSKSNAKLHNERAQEIKNQILKEVTCEEENIKMEAKENWDKMRFQFRYLFKEEYAEMEEDEIKKIIKKKGVNIPWDSLLFEQRKSVVTINYEGEIKDKSKREEIFKMNLKTAILNENYDLANKILGLIYTSKILLNDVIFQETIFKAAMEQSEITQNFAAVLTKTYLFDLEQTTTFLFKWLNEETKLSYEAKFNLLQLYSLVSYNLMNEWDLPSKRLSNVIHPSTFIHWLSEDLEPDLMLNLNLAFIRYFGQINDYANISKSFNFISNYFKNSELSIKDEIALVLFYNNWSRYDLTNFQLLRRYNKNELNEESAFILAKTITFYNFGETSNLLVKNVHKKAREFNNKRWCAWMKNSFQITRNELIKEMACAYCP